MGVAVAPPLDFAPFSATMSASESMLNTNSAEPLNATGILSLIFASADLPRTALNISETTTGGMLPPLAMIVAIYFTSFQITVPFHEIPLLWGLWALLLF